MRTAKTYDILKKPVYQFFPTEKKYQDTNQTGAARKQMLSSQKLTGNSEAQSIRMPKRFNVFSLSSKNVFNFFIGNFILFLFYILKNYVYVSLEFPVSKLKQDSTMIAHKGAMFFLFKDAG